MEKNQFNGFKITTRPITKKPPEIPSANLPQQEAFAEEVEEATSEEDLGGNHEQ